MVWLFILLPLLIISSMYIYRFDGKKELMKFDLIQFLYAFVVLPLFYVWFKTFVFLLIKNQLHVSLSINDLFFVDTIISLVFLFISSFVVIHSLTKSFDLKREQDPLFDLYELSEYFHLSLSHFVIYGGGLLVILCVSLLNLFLPLPIESSRWFLLGMIGLGLFAGVAFYISVANYRVATRKFRRIMKLFYGLGFIVNVMAYFIFNPEFSAHYSMYWLSFTAFATLVNMALFVNIVINPQQQKKSYTITLETARTYIRYIKHQFVKRLR